MKGTMANDRAPLSLVEPDMKISRIICCAQHMMRNVVNKVMWCRGSKVSSSLGFSSLQHHIIFRI